MAVAETGLAPAASARTAKRQGESDESPTEGAPRAKRPQAAAVVGNSRPSKKRPPSPPRCAMIVHGLPPSPQAQGSEMPSFAPLSVLVAAKTLQVRHGCELASSIVETSLSMGQAVVVLQTEELADGTRRALVVRRAHDGARETEPLGWVTCMHKEGSINLLSRQGEGASLELELARSRARAAAAKATAVVADSLAEAAAKHVVYTGATMPVELLLSRVHKASNQANVRIEPAAPSVAPEAREETRLHEKATERILRSMPPAAARAQRLT